MLEPPAMRTVKGRGLYLVTLLVVAVCLMQVAIWRRGRLERRGSAPAPAASGLASPDASGTGVVRVARILLDYLDHRAAGDGNQALLREALSEMGPPDTQIPGLRPLRVFCQRSLSLPATEVLDEMQEVAWQRMYGPSSDPAPFLRYLVSHYSRDPSARTQPEVVRELSLEFFRTDRTLRLKERILPHCPPLEGRTVVDIGCGVGTFLPCLLQAVGPGGTVWAEDFDPSCAEFIAWAGAHGLPALARVRTVTGTLTDVHLPPGRMDVAFLNDVHAGGFCEAFFNDPARLRSSLDWVGSIRACLRPAGRLLLLENGTDGAMGAEATARLFTLGGFRVRKVVSLPLGFLLDLERADAPRVTPGPG